MNEQPLGDAIIDVMEDFMLSPRARLRDTPAFNQKCGAIEPTVDSDSTLTTTHFLKPIGNSIHKQHFEFNPLSSSCILEPKEWPLKINFNGWHHRQEKWDSWVDELKLTYE